MKKYKGLKEYGTLKRKFLKDKEVRRVYDNLEFEFKLIEALIKRRIKKGLTQTELAKQIGTKQSAISRFESGTYNPTLSFVQKITRALDTEIKIS